MSDLNVTIPITSLDIFITYKFGNEDKFPLLVTMDVAPGI